MIPACILSPRHPVGGEARASTLFMWMSANRGLFTSGCFKQYLISNNNVTIGLIITIKLLLPRNNNNANVTNRGLNKSTLIQQKIETSIINVNLKNHPKFLAIGFLQLQNCFFYFLEMPKKYVQKSSQKYHICESVKMCKNSQSFFTFISVRWNFPILLKPHGRKNVCLARRSVRISSHLETAFASLLHYSTTSNNIKSAVFVFFACFLCGRVMMANVDPWSQPVHQGSTGRNISVVT